MIIYRDTDGTTMDLEQNTNNLGFKDVWPEWYNNNAKIECNTEQEAARCCAELGGPEWENYADEMIFIRAKKDIYELLGDLILAKSHLALTRIIMDEDSHHQDDRTYADIPERTKAYVKQLLDIAAHCIEQADSWLSDYCENQEPE